MTAESSYTYAFTSVDGGGYSSSALPTDAGKYKVTVTVAGTDAYGSVTGEAEFTIFPAVMAAPTLGSATTEYTGGEQTNTVVGYVGGVMTISGSVTMNGSEVLMTATGAGEYSVSVTLESANYVWSDDLPDYVDGSGQNADSCLDGGKGSSRVRRNDNRGRRSLRQCDRAFGRDGFACGRLRARSGL